MRDVYRVVAEGGGRGGGACLLVHLFVHGLPSQVVSDFRVLRRLLTYLSRYDCVSFYNVLERLHAANREQRCPSLWLHTSAGDSLVKAAKERVFQLFTVASDVPFDGLSVVDTPIGPRQ